MTQIELDKGILERLMSSEEITELTKDRTTTLTTTEVVEDDDDDDLSMPIVQVINIQNIATSAYLLKYNNTNNSKNHNTSTTTTTASSHKNEDTNGTTKKEITKTSKKNHNHTETSQSQQQQQQQQEQSSSMSSDRYLLILSDGEFYETRCLLLPNLNYLVHSAKLRKGSIIRLERYELNIIPNGKILVIDQLSVIKNTIKTSNKPKQHHHHHQQQQQTTNNPTSDKSSKSQQTVNKSIMNNSLAETLKSIGIIGSLKPTSNNSTNKKYTETEISTTTTESKKRSTKTSHKVCQNKTQQSNTFDSQLTSEDSELSMSTSLPSSLHQNQLISNFNKRFKQQTFEFKQQYELIEQKFKQILNSERKCLDSESSLSSSSSSNSLHNNETSAQLSKQQQRLAGSHTILARDRNNNSKELSAQLDRIKNGENSASEEKEEDEDGGGADGEEQADCEYEEDEEYDYGDEEDEDVNSENLDDCELKRIKRFKAGYKKFQRFKKLIHEDDSSENDEDENDEDEEEGEEEEGEEDDGEEEDEFEDDNSKSHNNINNDLILPHICKCSNCQDKNTLRLCYKMLNLNVGASKDRVKARYLSLVNSNGNESSGSGCEDIAKNGNKTDNNNKSNNLAYVDEGSDTECNLNKLIKNLTKNKIFTISEADRIEIITKAYNVIMGEEDGKENDAAVNKGVASAEVNAKCKADTGKCDDSEKSGSDDDSHSKMGDYLQYAWMRAANEFIRHQTSSQHNRSKKQQANINSQTSNKRTANHFKPSTIAKQPLDVESTTNKITLPLATSAAAESMPSILSAVTVAVVRNNNNKDELEPPILFQKQPQQQQYADEMLSSPSDSDSGSGSECEHQHSASHHLHSYHQPQRRRVNRNPKAFYQQIKKSNKTQSLKAMRSKLLQKSSNINKQQQKQQQSNQQHICAKESSTKAAHPTATSTSSQPISSMPLHKFIEAETSALPSRHTTNLSDLVWNRDKTGQFIMEQRGPIIHIKSANSASVSKQQLPSNAQQTSTDMTDSMNHASLSRSSSLSMKRPPAVIALPNVPSTSLPVINTEDLGDVELVNKYLLSSDSNSSIKQTFEQQIEKELEIHLDSINSFKEKLLNFTNEAKSVNLKRKSQQEQQQLATSGVVLETREEDDAMPSEQQELSKRREKNKRKKKKRLLQLQQQQQEQNGSTMAVVQSQSTKRPSTLTDTASLKQLKLEQDQLEKQLMEQQKLQQLQIEQLQKQIDEFVEAETNAANTKQQKSSLGSSGKSISACDISAGLDNLSKAIMRTNLNHIKGDQNKKNLLAASANNLNELTNKLEARIDFCDLVVLDETKKLAKLESNTQATKADNTVSGSKDACLDKDYLAMSKFEENLKKIDSFQSIIYSQDLESISSLISSITKQNCNTPAPLVAAALTELNESHLKCEQTSRPVQFESEILPLDLKHYVELAKIEPSSHLNSKCLSCSTCVVGGGEPEENDVELGMSLLKLSQEKSFGKTTARLILDRLDDLKEQKKLKLLTSKENSEICESDDYEDDDEEEDDCDEEEMEDDDEYTGTDECEEDEEDDDEAEPEKDQLITIIMKQPKECDLTEGRLLQKKYEKSNRLLIKDMMNRGYFKKLGSLGAKCVEESDNAVGEDTDESDEKDQEEEGEDDGGLVSVENEEMDDQEYDEEEFEQLSAALSCHSSDMTRAPLVEEFLKTINDEEDNMIFVQSLSSLAKKTLFNEQNQQQQQQQHQQRKLAKRKQVNYRDVAPPPLPPTPPMPNAGPSQHDQEVKLLQQQQASKEREFSKLNALFQEFERQQLEKKLIKRFNSNTSSEKSTNIPKIVELPADSKDVVSLSNKKQESSPQPIKLTKNQRKKLKKQAKKDKAEALKGDVNSDIGPIPFTPRLDCCQPTSLTKQPQQQQQKPPKTDSKSSKKKKNKAEAVKEEVVQEAVSKSKSKNNKNKKKGKKVAAEPEPKKQQRQQPQSPPVEAKSSQPGTGRKVSVAKLDEFNSTADESEQPESKGPTKVSSSKKPINDITDFSDLDCPEKTNNQKLQSNENRTVSVISSESNDSSMSDDQGSWVKVASNGQHVQEKRKRTGKASKVEVKKDTNGSGAVSTIKDSNSNKRTSRLGLDDFETELAKDDLLIPSSIDEEELMFRKALEMSLKESESYKTSTVTGQERNQVVKPSRLGLDDFSDSGSSSKVAPTTARQIKPQIQQQQQQPVARQQARAAPMTRQPVSVSGAKTKGILQQQKQRPQQHQQSVPLPAVRSQAIKVAQPLAGTSNKPISFAAVAAGSLKPKPSTSISSTVASSSAQLKKQQNYFPAIVPTVVSNSTNVASSQPFKWNSVAANKLTKSTPSTEIVKPVQPTIEMPTTSLTLGSYVPTKTLTTAIKSSPQNPLNQFKDNGIDRPISPQAEHNNKNNTSTASTVLPCDVSLSPLSVENTSSSSGANQQHLLSSLDLFNSQEVSAESTYQPMKSYAIENLFAADSSLTTVGPSEPILSAGESNSSHTRRSSDYFSLTNMASSLDEINASCLLPRLSVSSTSASLLTMPSTGKAKDDDIDTTPIEKSAPIVVSPAKKPIGAERVSARNSLISPNDVLQVVNEMNVKQSSQQQQVPKILTPPPTTTSHFLSTQPTRPSSTTSVTSTIASSCITGSKSVEKIADQSRLSSDQAAKPVQKQTIRVQPQQKLVQQEPAQAWGSLSNNPEPAPSPQSQTNIQIDQLQRFKQAQLIQQQQQQQQQALLNNLILLLSNNQGNIDQQQMTQLIVYVNQLLNQINSAHTNNFTGLTAQQQQQQQLLNQKINDNNLLMIKSIIQQQQQQQQFNQMPADPFLMGGSYSSIGTQHQASNDQNLFHNSNISNILNSSSSAFQQQPQHQFLKQQQSRSSCSSDSSTVWNTNNFDLSSSSSRFNKNGLGYMGKSQSPPPPQAQPMNSYSSSPSTYLVNPVPSNTNSHQGYNYFGNANSCVGSNMSSFSMGAKQQNQMGLSQNRPNSANQYQQQQQQQNVLSYNNSSNSYNQFGTNSSFLYSSTLGLGTNPLGSSSSLSGCSLLPNPVARSTTTNNNTAASSSASTPDDNSIIYKAANFDQH